MPGLGIANAKASIDNDAFAWHCQAGMPRNPQHRGRVVSIAELGFPACKAMLPSLAIFMMSQVGWHATWTATAAALLLIAVPALLTRL